MTAPPRRDGTTTAPDSGPRAARLAPMTNLPRHLTVFCTGLLLYSVWDGYEHVSREGTDFAAHPGASRTNLGNESAGGILSSMMA